MTAPSVKSRILTSMLFGMIVLGISTQGHSADPAPWVGQTLTGEKCVGNYVSFGPHDYLRRAQLPAELEVVERAHFTPEVERLEHGNTSEAINDIAYTIGAWPNHHRALYSAMRYRMVLWEWPEDAQIPPAECQLQRAIAFSPNDPVPYMMFGMLLHKAQKYDAALVSYQQANRLRPDDVLTLYNMGLTLVELKKYDEALQAAKTAYAAGIPLPGLKNKLIAAGQWPGSEKPAKATAATPKVQVQEPQNGAAKKASGEKVAQDGQPKPKQNTQDKPKPTSDTKPKPQAKKPEPNDASKPKPKDVAQPKPKPENKTTANTQDQSKETAPLATGDKQGVKTPVVTQ
ncbi:MAG: tetratricopeptide repeat protein [Haliea sp.]|nr:tetratricopeptide repeat protein [Haliea sp.]